MHNSIIYFSSEEDINLEKVKESIKFENEYPDPTHLSNDIDYVDYLYQSLTKENVQNIFVESIPYSPFKIDESFDGNNELIKIDVFKKDLINFLKCLTELKIEIEQEKFNLLKNKELDFTSHLSKSLMDKHNQLTHMENNETAGLFTLKRLSKSLFYFKCKNKFQKFDEKNHEKRHKNIEEMKNLSLLPSSEILKTAVEQSEIIVYNNTIGNSRA